MKRKPFTPPDERFLNTFSVCRPCHDHGNLWAKYHDAWGVPWEEDSLGMWTEIGKVDKRPIVVSVHWANIAGRRVAFVEPTSMLVDYQMVEDWCSDVFPNAVAFGDENNFHNVISPIANALGVKSILARNHVFDIYAKYAPKNPDFMKSMVGGTTRTPDSMMGVAYKNISRRELPKDPTNGGWKKKLLSMDWYDLCSDGYPGWEMDPSDGRLAPAFVKLTHTRGSGNVESSDLASTWDDVATEPFYTRDWTDDGIPFVNKGEIYWAGWWFKTVAERDRFVKWRGGAK